MIKINQEQEQDHKDDNKHDIADEINLDIDLKMINVPKQVHNIYSGIDSINMRYNFLVNPNRFKTIMPFDSPQLINYTIVINNKITFDCFIVVKVLKVINILQFKHLKNTGMFNSLFDIPVTNVDVYAEYLKPSDKNFIYIIANKITGYYYIENFTSLNLSVFKNFTYCIKHFIRNHIHLT